MVWNTHLSWITYWLLFNDELAVKDPWGLTYYMFDVPDPVQVTMLVLTGSSALVVVRDLFHRWRSERTLPVNGLVAYFVSIYVWLMIGFQDLSSSWSSRHSTPFNTCA